MKIIIAIIFLHYSLFTFCQTGQLIGTVTKQVKNLEYQYLTVLLKRGDSTIMTSIPNTNGHFVLHNIDEGLYSLIVKQIGYRDEIIYNLKILSAETNELNITYPGPCKFVYPNRKKPKCISEHSDNIIPIVYGLPTKKNMEKARKGFIHLGGCIVTDCDPRYYCTIHKTEL